MSKTQKGLSTHFALRLVSIGPVTQRFPECEAREFLALMCLGTSGTYSSYYPRLVGDIRYVRVVNITVCLGGDDFLLSSSCPPKNWIPLVSTITFYTQRSNTNR